MHITDTIRRSGRSLRSAKVRTILTALAIAVGGFTLALTLAASNGLRTYTDKLIESNFDPAELLVGRDREVSNNGTPKETPQEFDESIGTLEAGGPGSSFQVKRVTRADVEELEAKPYVERVRESYQITIRYVTREGQQKYTGSVEAFNPAQKPELAAGAIPTGNDLETGTILLPESYVTVLGFSSNEDAIGKTVQVTVQQPFSSSSLQALLGNLQAGQSAESVADQAKPQEQVFTYKVSGITKKAATSLSFGVMPMSVSSEDGKTLYDYTTQGTPDYEKYVFVFVRVKDGQNDANLEAAKADLVASEYYVQSSKDLQKAITQFVDILTIMVGVFGMITVIASIFGIVNTQYISVLERTREIGLMKALGMSRRNISRLFNYEAIWIGFIGGLIGIAGGFGLGTLINPWITKKLDLGAGNDLLIFDGVQLLVLLFVLMLIGALAGWLPARRAGKLDPIEALRSE